MLAKVIKMKVMIENKRHNDFEMKCKKILITHMRTAGNKQNE